MNKKSTIKRTVLFVLPASLIVAAVITFFLTLYYRQVCFQMLGGFCGRMIQKYPDSRQQVLEVWKAQDFYGTDADIVKAFGYQPSNLAVVYLPFFRAAILGFFTGGLLFLFSFWYWHKKSDARIQALTGYLERVHTGGQGLLFESSEDEFSKLQDEIYKTVTALCQTREDALAARNRFAENLFNIAHQLKTPLTSISLTVQMAEKHLGGARAAESPREHTSVTCKMHAYIKDIGRQANRLMHLEEALLLLARMDAGALVFDRKPTDVFTILSLASDNLYELSVQKGVLIDVPEMGEMNINVDINWTMEAVMNLMKNCMEATGTGAAVHCSYENNPLYVQIRIWDEGDGFAKKDLPHLFERFYRGEKAENTGIGIGLSLSKAIIEMQNGIIRAYNLPNGGACFEICFYSH